MEESKQFHQNLKDAFKRKITKEESQRIFDKVESDSRKFQKQLLASRPSKEDRERIYYLPA